MRRKLISFLEITIEERARAELDGIPIISANRRIVSLTWTLAHAVLLGSFIAIDSSVHDKR